MINNMSTKRLQLEELIPAEAEIEIQGKTYTLRKFTQSDRVWANARYGQNEWQRIFDQQDWSHLVYLLYRLMKDKSDFLPRKEEVQDDDGNAVEQVISGPQRLLEALDGGIPQTVKIFHAICATLGASQPLVDKLVEEEMAKMTDEAKKKVNPTDLTGEKSSTTSQVSTDTP